VLSGHRHVRRSGQRSRAARKIWPRDGAGCGGTGGCGIVVVLVTRVFVAAPFSAVLNRGEARSRWSRPRRWSLGSHFRHCYGADTRARIRIRDPERAPRLVAPSDLRSRYRWREWDIGLSAPAWLPSVKTTGRASASPHDRPSMANRRSETTDRLEKLSTAGSRLVTAVASHLNIPTSSSLCAWLRCAKRPGRGSPDEVVDKILRNAEALGGFARISFQ